MNPLYNQAASPVRPSEAEAICCHQGMTKLEAFTLSIMGGMMSNTPEAILSQKRDSHIVLPRHVSMMLCREYTTLSLKGISAEFGRNHAMIQHACESITHQVQENAGLAAKVGTIRATIVSTMSANARSVRTKDNRLRPALAARAVFIGYRAWRVK